MPFDKRNIFESVTHNGPVVYICVYKMFRFLLLNYRVVNAKPPYTQQYTISMVH